MNVKVIMVDGVRKFYPMHPNDRTFAMGFAHGMILCQIGLYLGVFGCRWLGLL